MGKKRSQRRREPTEGDERIAELEARIEFLRQQTRDERKFSPLTVRAERERLELSAADFAELVGVSVPTVYSWEHGRTRPRQAQLQKWLSVKGIGKREAWKRLGY